MLVSAQADTAKFRLYLAPATAPDDSLSSQPMELVSVHAHSGSAYYFLLPASWDTGHLRIFFTGGDTLTIADTVYHSGDAISLPLDQKLVLKSPKGQNINLTVRQSSHIPAMFITTESGSSTYIHAAKGNREPGYLRMVDADGTVEYDGALNYIRSRGNSTFKYEKKPYQIKLASGAPLAGMKSDKTFILLSNLLDKAEIRNTVALDLARYSGAYSFVPAAQAVDLYVNHDYRGTYLLTEKVEIDSDRLDIADLEEELELMNPGLDFTKLKRIGREKMSAGATKSYAIPNEPADYTGGYLVLANIERYYNTELSGFVTKQGFPFTLQEPKYATQTEIKYISGLFQQIENALLDKNGVDPVSGKHYSELVDMTSFVNRYLQAEVTNDNDGQLTYLYKDWDRVDTKVYFGPVWDQDNIWGAGTKRMEAKKLRLQSDRTQPYYWFTKAYKHDDFKDALILTYNSVYTHALAILLGEEKDPAGILRSLDEYAEEIGDSAQMDWTRWPLKVRHAYPNFNETTGKTFQDNIEYLRKFIFQRKAVLDAAFDLSKLKNTASAVPAETAAPTAAPAQARTVSLITATPPAATPTAAPTQEPTATPAPTQAPTPVPTAMPTATPSPTPAPSPSPTPVPTLAPTVAPALEFPMEGEYVTLQTGSVHPTVYWLKLRLYALGYINGKKAPNVNFNYTKGTATQIKALQKANGLAETGVATPELQAFIYSDACIGLNPAPLATAAPKATTEPIGPITTPELPALDAEGFLPAGSEEEFVYKDAKDGLWYYISDELYVEIRCYKQKKPVLQWYETRVKMRGSIKPTTIFSNGKFNSTAFKYPYEIARKGQAVLAVSDDCYTYRTTENKNSGIIIRNGKIIEDRPFVRYDINNFPMLSVMAFMPDGTMAVYENNTTTAQALWNMGVENTYSFGPILVKNGREYNSARYGTNQMHVNKHPRNAIGMLAPNDYLFITVVGREKYSEGVDMAWMVDKMLEKGVETAFNLDGGNSVSLEFMGSIINRKTEKAARQVTSMICFGTSDLVPTK